MPPVGFEPKMSAGERQQTHALDSAATGFRGEKKVTERKECCLISSKTSDPNISHSQNNHPDSTNVLYRSSRNVPLFLSDFNGTDIFSTDFQQKENQTPNFMKTHPVGTEKFCAEGRTSRLCRSLSVILRTCLRSSQSMPYSKTMAVCSEIRIRTICVRPFELPVMWT